MDNLLSDERISSAASTQAFAQPSAQSSLPIDADQISIDTISASRYVQVPDAALVYAIGGEVDLSFCRYSLALAANDVCLIKPSVGFRIEPALGASAMLVSIPKPLIARNLVLLLSECPGMSEFLSGCLSRQQASYFCTFRYDGKGNVAADMELLFAENAREEVGYRSAEICQLGIVLVGLARQYRPEAKATGVVVSSEKAAAVARYISEHCADVTLGVVAQHFGYHPNTISLMLRNEYGMTFRDIVRQSRLDKAVALMRCGMSVEEASSTCGYEDVASFYHVFRSQFDTTPRKYIQRLSIA